MKRRIEKVIAKIEIITDNPAVGSLSDHRERLHSDYPKHFPWSPHATLFCGEEGEVSAARDRIAPQFRPLRAVVTALEMGAFFPPQFICRQALTGKNA